MKARGILTVTLAIMLLAGCSTEKVPVKTESNNEVVSSNTTVDTEDTKEIMELRLYTSGEETDTWDEFGTMTSKYTIYYNGVVEKNNGDKIKLSDTDVSDIRKYYNNFRSMNVDTSSDLVLGTYGYYVTVYCNGDTIEYAWDSKEQTFEARELCEIVEAYFHEYPIER